MNFYLFLGVPIFKGPEKYTRGVKKIGQRNFCVLWTLKGHKKQKLKNEHENQAEWQNTIHYMVLFDQYAWQWVVSPAAAAAVMATQLLALTKRIMHTYTQQE